MGLYYYRARYYSPELGRFLQVDPVGYREGLNLYTYCHNNPVNWVDPLGLGASGSGGGDDEELEDVSPDWEYWIDVWRKLKFWINMGEWLWDQTGPYIPQAPTGTPTKGCIDVIDEAIDWYDESADNPATPAYNKKHGWGYIKP